MTPARASSIAAGGGQSTPADPPRSDRRFAWIATIAVVVAGLFVVGILELASVFRADALDRERETAATSLALIEVGLAGELAKFQTAAEILAGDDGFRAFLRGDETVSIDEINMRLEEAREEADALDVYLLDRSGMTLAASNWDQEVSFVGRNFGYRPYFQDAIAGGVGQFFAVGTTSNLRGYYFAYPIVDRGEPIGVVAVKMEVDRLETIWDSSGSDVMVADDNGVVFMAADPRWRLSSLRPLEAEALERIRQTRQYPEGPRALVPIEIVETLSDHERIVRLPGNTAGDRGLYLMQEHPMPQAGWTLILLNDLTGVDEAVWQDTLLVAACGVALAGLLWVAFERHRRTSDRLQSERQHRSELEALVDERTKGLQTAYDELRSMQERLVLNSRFAVMGRLSAGLSHEISQPLTAMGAHLDSARELMVRDRLDDARARLADVDRLTARITTILRQLRNLAHGSPISLAPVTVRRAAETAIGLCATDLGSIDLELNVDPSIQVMAEPVLLEQVFVNLLTNAAHALRARDKPQIVVGATSSGDRVEIEVADNGPGIDPQIISEVFEPFLTTRSGQGGLGLGLTIVQDTINRFGGRAQAANRPEGQGLIVKLVLRSAAGTKSSVILS
ncbi:MAG: ATP-binding protein [Pseudomonadota bacterium]